MKGKTAFSRLKEQEKEARRSLILEAAQRVFAAKPFGKVSMRDIAKEADISPPSIYTYFSDQETLFLEAALRGTQDMIDAFAAGMNRDHNLGLDQVAETFIRYLTEHDLYFRMMAHFMLHTTVSSSSLAKLSAMERSVLDIFDASFRKIGACGDVRLLSHAFFAALNGVLITFRRYPGRSEKEGLDHMLRLAKVLCGLFSTVATTKTTPRDAMP